VCNYVDCDVIGYRIGFQNPGDTMGNFFPNLSATSHSCVKQTIGTNALHTKINTDLKVYTPQKCGQARSSTSSTAVYLAWGRENWKSGIDLIGQPLSSPTGIHMPHRDLFH
jgi:hypothetical protein